ncbi:MAG: nuclear transport factor 2 family protein [Candidatus Obscuribacterales bacterium]
MVKNWKATLLSIAIGSGTVLASEPCTAAGSYNSPKQDKSAAKTESSAKDAQEDAVRSVLLELSKAIAAGDAEKTAGLWADDAVFIDEAGDESRGRAALLERFTHGFKQRDPSSIGLHPEHINLPADNVAMVVGSVTSKTSGVELPAARFSMVLVKQKTGWLINQVSETVIQEVGAADHLQELQWLIGKWQVSKTDNAAILETTWAPGRTFIHSRCTFNRGGAQQVDNQVIGWDPRSKTFVSWHFDQNGGFGYGKWNHKPDGWQIDFAGVGGDGSSTRATNIFTMKGPDEFVWQSIDQTSDGNAVADCPALTLQRVKP